MNDLVGMKPAAAFVLTPKDTHYEICKQLLKANVDVYVEKPGTIKSSELYKLCEMAKQKQLVFMVGFNRRFAPLHIQGQKFVSGLAISSAFFQKTRQSSINMDIKDLLLEDAVHQIDMLRFYCGEAEVVSTVCLTERSQLVNLTSILALENVGYAVIAYTLQGGGWSETYPIHAPRNL